MATPMSADRLVTALRAEGVKVAEYKSWRTHNRNRAGAWGPVHGVMIHHTVTSGTDGSVRLCYEGRSDLPGPLCHGVIAKDGTVHLVGHGRANHAGRGDGDVLAAVIAERDLPADNESDTDGNVHFYGFEAINLGDNKDTWPAAQVEAIVRASAALCRAHGWGKDGDTSVIGHLEWQPGKVDPRGPGISMGDVRRRVAERLRHPASWSPEADDHTSETGDGMPKRTLVGTSTGRRQTLRPGEWLTLVFDREYDGGWDDRPARQTIIGGPAYYTASVGIRLQGLEPGAEVQMRLGTNYRTGDAWHEGSRTPINSPVHVGGGGHFTYTWTSHLGGRRDDRLVAEVLIPAGDQPVTIDWARAEVLHWPA